jgi:Flp pilus assembly protein TadG
MKPTGRLIRRFKDATGATLLEAAVITPLLLLLTFSIADFGGLFYAYLALENGVSQATRFAVTGNIMGSLSREDSIKAAMRSATPTLTIPDGAFAFQNMPVGGTSWVGGTGGPGAIEKVTITYSWPLMTPLLRPFFPSGSLTMKVESMMKNESRFK